MITDHFSLKGKVAIVTGGGKGIGKAIGLAFAEAGANVVFAARTQADIDAAVVEAKKSGIDAIAIHCDVLVDEQLQQLVDKTVAHFGRIDILVNNAGGTMPKPMEKISANSFRRALDFNVTSAFLLSQYALPHLRASKGNIINIASAAGRLVQPLFTSYGTVKAALIHMTKMMAAELAPDVRVNVISPGSIMTEALETFIDADNREKMRKLTPLQQLGMPQDIALAALYLASPAARWVTGKDLQVDGGTENTNLAE
ncbi:MAG TPA: glucose 1-dehydrogenase [Pseudomonadales bacterium]|nr:glucose 1-dehydrogenase [Pseudomonadales bacterium]